MKKKKLKCTRPVKSTLFDFKIYKTIKDVSQDVWKTITGESVFLDKAYLHALEQSEISGLGMRYVVVERNSEPVASLQYQLLNVADKDLNGVVNLKDKGWLLNNLHEPLNQLMFKCGSEKPNYLICCGSLLVSGEYGIKTKSKEILTEVAEHLPLIIEAIKESYPGASFCGCMIKDFYDIAPLDMVVSRHGYFAMPMDPEMIFYVHDDWKNFQGYLGALSAKYRLKANNSLSKIAHLEKRFLSLNEIIKYKEQLMQLYYNVQQRATIQLIRISETYFSKLKEQMPEQFYVKAFFEGEKMVAFTSGFHIEGVHHEAHFIGIDYHANAALQLYQNILYSYIDDAIAMKSKHVYFGRTAMEMKTSVGAKAFPLYCYFRLENKIMNKMVKTILNHWPEQKWTPRNPFKE